MSRLSVFYAYETHPWLKRVFNKLSKNEKDLAVAFITQNDGLNKGEFELRVNRMFMDVKDKPKNWTAVLELITCANSAIE